MNELQELLELIKEEGKKNPELNFGELLWRVGTLEYMYNDTESYESNILDPSVFSNEEVLVKAKLKVKLLK